MEKPKLTDYCKLPTSTSTDLRLNYNYEQYSIALENYIKYLKKEINRYIQKR